jgi:hypothetical protein
LSLHGIHWRPCFISEIEDLPRPVQKQLFDELLDGDVQKGNDFYFMYLSLERQIKKKKFNPCLLENYW